MTLKMVFLILRLQITRKVDKIRMDSSVMKSFFKEALDDIVSHIKELLSQPETKGVNTIVMVGGFSESELLTSEIRSSFPKMKVVVPKEAGLAVLKGAVIFGHLPTVISKRISKYTYGINTRSVFNPKIHDRRNIVVGEDRRERCLNTFSKLVEIGQLMVVNQVQKEKSYLPVMSAQATMPIDVYISKEKDPLYVTNPGCKKIGTFKVELSGQGLDREVKIKAIFGGTEIYFDCIEVATKKVTRLDIDFLSE